MIGACQVNRSRPLEGREMIALHEYQTNDGSREWMDSLEHLVRWIAPRTVGHARVLQQLAEVKKAGEEIHRRRDALCLLSRELDALYPQGPVVTLARQRVRDAVLTLSHK
jgi:hypothetical protein